MCPAMKPEIKRLFFASPYRGGPDFRFLYTTDQVKEAMAKCILLTVERVNPVYMYGPFGTGKSTIIRRLYALLRRTNALTSNLSSSMTVSREIPSCVIFSMRSA